jgi:hypothetical protein
MKLKPWRPSQDSTAFLFVSTKKAVKKLTAFFIETQASETKCPEA